MCLLLGQGRYICKYDFHRERIANKKQEDFFFFLLTQEMGIRTAKGEVCFTERMMGLVLFIVTVP